MHFLLSLRFNDRGRPIPFCNLELRLLFFHSRHNTYNKKTKTCTNYTQGNHRYAPGFLPSCSVTNLRTSLQFDCSLMERAVELIFTDLGPIAHIGISRNVTKLNQYLTSRMDTNCTAAM